jgi:hypothetical protein
MFVGRGTCLGGIRCLPVVGWVREGSLPSLGVALISERWKPSPRPAACSLFQRAPKPPAHASRLMQPPPPPPAAPPGGRAAKIRRPASGAWATLCLAGVVVWGGCGPVVQDNWRFVAGGGLQQTGRRTITARRVPLPTPPPWPPRSREHLRPSGALPTPQPNPPVPPPPPLPTGRSAAGASGTRGSSVSRSAPGSEQPIAQSTCSGARPGRRPTNSAQLWEPSLALRGRGERLGAQISRAFRALLL